MADRIEKLGNSLIQHGRMNDRIYLIKLSERDIPSIIGKMNDMALSNEYTKIFAKVPAHFGQFFIDDGYEQEAAIPAFYNGTENALFMGKFLSEERKCEPRKQEIQKVLDTARGKRPADRGILRPGFGLGVCSADDSKEIAGLYEKVFETYPFPIYNHAYIRKTMEKNVLYFGIRHKGRLISLSSTEMYPEYKSVEMTDFATLPDYRGMRLPVYQLYSMEEEMAKRGFITAYTIARAVSYGMNITFAKARYKYGGTLVKNTNIAGRLESMNVWYKRIQ